MRSDTKLLPSRASNWATDRPASKPLTRAAVTTTGTALKRSAKPITITATPSSGQ